MCFSSECTWNGSQIFGTFCKETDERVVGWLSGDGFRFLFGNKSATDSFDVIVVVVVIAERSPGNKSKSVVKLKRY